MSSCHCKSLRSTVGATWFIAAPRTYNDPGEKAGFINGTGAPDLYGLVSARALSQVTMFKCLTVGAQDDYPNEFNCTNGSSWNPIHTNYHQYHITNEPDRPFYMPEFQGTLRAIRTEQNADRLLMVPQEALTITGAVPDTMPAERASDLTSRTSSTRIIGLLTSRCTRSTCSMGKRCSYDDLYRRMTVYFTRGTSWGAINYPGAYTR